LSALKRESGFVRTVITTNVATVISRTEKKVMITKRLNYDGSVRKPQSKFIRNTNPRYFEDRVFRDEKKLTTLLCSTYFPFCTDRKYTKQLRYLLVYVIPILRYVRPNDRRNDSLFEHISYIYETIVLLRKESQKRLHVPNTTVKYYSVDKGLMLSKIASFRKQSKGSAIARQQDRSSSEPRLFDDYSRLLRHRHKVANDPYVSPEGGHQRCLGK